MLAPKVESQYGIKRCIISVLSFFRCHAFPFKLLFIVLSAVFLETGGVYSPGLGQESPDSVNRASRDWKRIRTAHFEAVGNAPVEKVVKILAHLEAFHDRLVTKFLMAKTASPVPTLVVVFKDADSFSRFKPRDENERKRDAGGYFHQSFDMNYIVLPIESYGADTLRVIFHEYCHFVIHRNIPNVPAWMNEGLAELFSTCEIDSTSGQMLIGRYIPRYIQRLRVEGLLPLEQILTRDGAMKLMNSREPRRVLLFYAQSWALVHYFMFDQKGRRQTQLNAYLDAIQKGMSTEEAFQVAFKMTFAKAREELESYIHQLGFTYMRVGQRMEELSAASTIETLTDSEAQYLQGDLLTRIGAYSDAEQVLEKLLKLSPSYVPAKVSLAGMRTKQNRSQEAIDILRPIAESEPANFRAHFHLGQAYAASELYDDALREYQQAAAINNQSLGSWMGISLAAMNLGRQADSDAALEKLQKIEDSPNWYRDRAYEAFKAGIYAVGISDARKFIEKAGRGAESSPYMAFLGALCCLRLGQVSESEELLEAVRPEIAEDSWQMKVMNFMQGRTTEDKFLSSAKDVYERTEAHAYIGFKELIADKHDQAVTHLQWVREKGAKNYFEYSMAIEELKRLDKSESKSQNNSDRER